MQLPAQPLQQRPIFVEQQHRHKPTGHRQQRQHQADAKIEPLGIRVSAAAENTLHKQFDESPKGLFAEFLPSLLPTHAALITSTMSPATRTVSTSSTRCKNVFSSDAPRIFPIFATESCAITFPLRRISTSVQTFSTTSSTCEQ